jgi:ABC-type multidrug transport system fused ATPase/permease subunit
MSPPPTCSSGPAIPPVSSSSSMPLVSLLQLLQGLHRYSVIGPIHSPAHLSPFPLASHGSLVWKSCPELRLLWYRRDNLPPEYQQCNRSPGFKHIWRTIPLRCRRRCFIPRLYRYFLVLLHVLSPHILPGLGMLVCTYTYMIIWVYTGEVNAKRVREKYLQAVLRQDIAYFDTVGAGEVATRIQTDTRTPTFSLLLLFSPCA